MISSWVTDAARCLVRGAQAVRPGVAAADDDDLPPAGADRKLGPTPEGPARKPRGCIHSYWQELGFEANITPKLKGHWSKLTKHIQTFEQFKSLYEYTRQQIENDQKIKNKHVNPGNLTNDNNLNGWKQRPRPAHRMAAGDPS